MTENRISLGPKGWAILTLAGGAALASPFLHPPVARPLHDSPEHNTFAQNGRAQDSDWQSDSPSDSEGPDSVVRIVSGTLPSTTLASSDAPMPEWARSRSKLDEIMAQGAVDAPINSTLSRNPPTQMKTWTSTWQDRPQTETPPMTNIVDTRRASSTARQLPSSPWENVSPDGENSRYRTPPQLKSPTSNPSSGHLAQQSGSLVGNSTARNGGTGRNRETQREGNSGNPAREQAAMTDTRKRLTQPTKRVPQYVYQPGMKRD